MLIVDFCFGSWLTCVFYFLSDKHNMDANPTVFQLSWEQIVWLSGKKEWLRVKNYLNGEKKMVQPEGKPLVIVVIYLSLLSFS